MFGLTDKEKSEFLSEIIQYWLLSVKDKKWSYERERRYVLFLYDEYDYTELNRKDANQENIMTSTIADRSDIAIGDAELVSTIPHEENVIEQTNENSVVENNTIYGTLNVTKEKFYANIKSNQIINQVKQTSN